MRLSRSASSTYGSCITTWKHVCVYAAAWSWSAAPTSDGVWPVLRTARPAPRAISLFPSTSSTMAPDAVRANTGTVLNTAAGTAASRRCRSSRERGPGISVTILRAWSMDVLPLRFRQSTGALPGQQSRTVRCGSLTLDWPRARVQTILVSFTESREEENHGHVHQAAEHVHRRGLDPRGRGQDHPGRQPGD